MNSHILVRLAIGVAMAAAILLILCFNDFLAWCSSHGWQIAYFFFFMLYSHEKRSLNCEIEILQQRVCWLENNASEKEVQLENVSDKVDSAYGEILEIRHRSNFL